MWQKRYSAEGSGRTAKMEQWQYSLTLRAREERGYEDDGIRSHYLVVVNENGIHDDVCLEAICA